MQNLAEKVIVEPSTLSLHPQYMSIFVSFLMTSKR